MRTEPSFSEESGNALDDVDQSASALSARFDADSSALADYRQRYGLSTDPFVDDPHFPFYQGAQRRQILEQLLHLCQFSQNLLVVTGDYGVGKTRMAQAMIDSLDDADDICFVEGQVTADIKSVLADVYDQFELTSHEEFLELCSKKTEQDGLVVLIIDNAHHLSDEVILELIGLLQANPESRLHLVLFSEPYLLDRLESINAPDIVLTDFFLQKFSLAEAVDYLNFRMEMADYLGPEIFVENKVEPWWRQSQGQLLQLHEYAHEKLLESVSKPQRSKAYLSEKRGLPIPHIVAASALVGGLFFWYFYQGQDAAPEESKATSSIPVAPQSVAASSLSNLAVQTSSAAAVVNDASSASTAYSSVAAESQQPQPDVKQSVVPLVQTSELQNGSTKQTKAAAPAAVSEEKRSSAASEPAKQAAKAKTESSIASEPKVGQTFSDQEKSILAWNPSEYTLQLVGLSNEKAALDFIAQQPNKKDLLLFKSKRAGKDWFVVVTGHYPSSAKARQAIQDLTEGQRKATPWPREVKVIQQEIRQRDS